MNSGCFGSGFCHSLFFLEKIMDNLIEEFYLQAIETLLWSECDPDTMEPLDNDYSVDDVSEETKKELKEQCRDFVVNNFELLCQTPEEYTFESAGHDFALTRNGHGAGFWDRGLGAIGKALTEQCKAYGSFYLYAGDDGRLYHHG